MYRACVFAVAGCNRFPLALIAIAIVVVVVVVVVIVVVGGVAVGRSWSVGHTQPAGQATPSFDAVAVAFSDSS
ncbi:unnamed protein product [Haemonchus placei]|uniref:Pulmonary surfactant-associated protein C n=1 Tax=Haemonchus placei TaxID=6290 RepID=A0A0N4W9P1_HAEPC|nr:unnamed protein product [Haemonchus placei]